MIHNRNVPQQSQPGIAFGGDGSGVMVMGEQLREVNAPVEGIVGAGHSAVQGLILSMIGSAAVTASKSSGRTSIPMIMEGARTHMGVILGATAAASAIGGFVRYARAAKHNEWSQKHYDFLREQNAEKQQEDVRSFSGREEERKAHSANKEVGA